MIRNLLGLFFLVIGVNCSSKQQENNISTKLQLFEKISPNRADTLKGGGHTLAFENLIDTLTKEEKAFFSQLANEDEFILLSNEVQRIYCDSNSLAPTINKLIYSKEYLQDKGYISFELEFYGNISEPNVKYTFNLGQASHGFGTVVGNDLNDYIHTLKSCGLSSCIVQVFENGKKILEAER